MSDIIFEQRGYVLVCTLNRPDFNNSINAAMYADLITRLREAEQDDSVRVVVTRAEGKCWCVGADSGDLRDMPERGLTNTFTEIFAGKIGVDTDSYDEIGIGHWALAFASLQKPMIASLQGPAAGGGLSLSLLHHFRIASEKAKFTTAFGRLGIGVELGLSVTLPTLVGRQAAMDMLATSRLVKAEEALEMGLVDKVVATGELDQATMEYAELLAQQAPLALRAGLQALSRQWLNDLRAQLQIEWRDQKYLFASSDFREGVDAMLQERAPVFRGK